MKRLNNSQPLAVAVQYAPLSTSMHIVVQGGMTTLQFYKQTLAEWIPDHSHQFSYDDKGAQTDGPLVLSPDYSIIDPDGLVGTDSLYPQVFWFVDGSQVSDSDPASDYYLMGTSLVVRKNFTHLSGATIYCECRFTDTRTGNPFVLSDTLTLSAILQADEQWQLNILCDRTRKHAPISTTATEYSFEAEARLGAVDKTNEVAWFWDYSTDNGATWQDFGATDHFYVSGKNAAILTIDADFIDFITVRCRVSTDKTSSAPSLPNEATASLAWRYPTLQPVVFCYGGDKVLEETEKMTFGLMVHHTKHNDLTPSQQREWLLCDWVLRKQGASDTPTPLRECDIEVTVPVALLRNTAGIKYIADPQCSIRGPFAQIQTSSGDDIQTSSGDYITVRE